MLEILLGVIYALLLWVVTRWIFKAIKKVINLFPCENKDKTISKIILKILIIICVVMTLFILYSYGVRIRRWL